MGSSGGLFLFVGVLDSVLTAVRFRLSAETRAVLSLDAVGIGTEPTLIGQRSQQRYVESDQFLYQERTHAKHVG